MKNDNLFLTDLFSAENTYICEIRMTTVSDETICGIPLGHDEKSLILYNLAEGGYLPDGFMILWRRGISAYRVFDCADDFIRRRQLKLGINPEDGSFCRAYSPMGVISALSAQRQLVAVYGYDKWRSFIVGTIESFNGDGISLKTVDDFGRDDDMVNMAIKNISKIEFQSRYLGFISKLRG